MLKNIKNPEILIIRILTNLTLKLNWRIDIMQYNIAIDLMFWGMQDFDFAQSQSLLPKFVKFA